MSNDFKKMYGIDTIDPVFEGEETLNPQNE